ncbi:MAG: 4Fe-4S dicluster domain-containing protein [Candidatus Hydrogenedentes bacterium]|nr:4Fe-4S dicluster domain-containing protein [Candidatus Hydrogenedentota bacterium]
MAEFKLNEGKLDEFVNALKGKGYRVFAPLEEEGAFVFKEVGNPGEMRLDVLRTARSIKELFFPRVEPTLSYRFDGGSVTCKGEQPESPPKTAIIGCRPCDAASLPILDKLFDWDYRDEYWFKRREATTVISVACDAPDSYCFCTSVRGSPDGTEGSDVLMKKTRDSYYLLEAVTEKGRSIIEAAKGALEPATGNEEALVGEVPQRFDLKDVRPWLDKNFDHDYWKEISYKCLSCGVCAFVCPTCHCFDIQDEANLERGVRLKSWDSCCFPIFTLHASGYNPRATRDARYRQRVMHKFSYYIDKFGVTACVGCGRCSVSCPIDMNICTVVAGVAEQAETST